MDVEKFSEKLARLKHELRVSKDGEVAKLLGLSATAFSERKKRESFFEKEVAARPELLVDLNYVVTGSRVLVYRPVGWRFKAERRRLGLTAAFVAKALGLVNAAAVHEFEARDINVPPHWDATLLALGFDLVFIKTGKYDALDPALSVDETQLIRNYRKMDANGQTAVKQMAATLAQKDAPKNTEKPSQP